MRKEPSLASRRNRRCSSRQVEKSPHPEVLEACEGVGGVDLRGPPRLRRMRRRRRRHPPGGAFVSAPSLRSRAGSSFRRCAWCPRRSAEPATGGSRRASARRGMGAGSPGRRQVLMGRGFGAFGLALGRSGRWRDPGSAGAQPDQRREKSPAAKRATSTTCAFCTRRGTPVQARIRKTS